MTVNEFIEKYKSENFSSYLKENATIDYWNDLIKTFKIERLNFVFPDTLVLNPMNVLNENGSPFNVQFDGFCERQIKILEIENQYQSVKKDIRYIDEVEKDQIFAEMVFARGLYYYSDVDTVRISNKYKDLENNFETKEDFAKAVRSLLHANGLHFYAKLRSLTNETEFIKHIQNQYNLYNEYTPNNSLNWLNFTKKAIMYGFGILRIDPNDLKVSFVNWYNEIIQNLEVEQPKQETEINSYLKSYNQISFDEVSNKRKGDGTINNIYLGNNFNEWLENINKNLYSNKSYDTEIQEKLSDYNKYLCALANNLISLYKAISGYEKTKNTAFKTSIHLKEKKVFNRLNSINFYAEIIKTFVRNKQYSKANDIKEYCLALLDNLIYNLNDVLTIDVYKSPLKTDFESVKTDLKNSINFEELKILKDLSEIKSEIPTQDYKKSSLINNENITLKGIYQPIVLTLKEYESIYEGRLFEHLNIHIDYDVNHFISEEKNNYEFYYDLIDSIRCIPDDMMNKKHKFAVINIADFDYNNLYFREGAIDSFFYQSEENDKGCVIIEEARPDVMNVINLFKNLTFDEFIFKGHNLKNSFRLIIKFLKKKRKELNVNKIKTQTDLNVQIEQAETKEPDESLLKNEDVKIFKNDFAFTLFYKMFEMYKPENRDLANFSFLFFAMEKDFLVCSQADFVKFLEIEKYNVNIDKIDSRQWHLDMNQNKKTKLYNSIKEPLQKKHNLSTI